MTWAEIAAAIILLSGVVGLLMHSGERRLFRGDELFRREWNGDECPARYQNGPGSPWQRCAEPFGHRGGHVWEPSE